MKIHFFKVVYRHNGLKFALCEQKLPNQLILTLTSDSRFFWCVFEIRRSVKINIAKTLQVSHIINVSLEKIKDLFA